MIEETTTTEGNPVEQPAEQTEPKPIVVPVPEDRQRRIRFDSEDISA